jgi:lipopolysaccharide export LptBFGC system permease protein LptF
MSDIGIVLIAVAVSVPVALVVLLLALWTLPRVFPQKWAELQKLLLAGSFGSKLRESEQRLGLMERALREQEQNFEKEVEAGKKAERAMTDVLQGLTRSALRNDERLGAIERKDR